MLFLGYNSIAQNSTARFKTIVLTSDTTVLDTLPIVYASFSLDSDNKFEYEIDYLNSSIITKNQDYPLNVEVSYRVFSIPLNYAVSLKDTSVINLEKDVENPFLIKAANSKEDIFSTSGLEKNGSISRGVNFGNNQDLSVNSNLNLQMSGRVAKDIYVLASVTDDNIPIQPAGNTQQLQDFDQVFIKLYDKKKWEVTAGDFWLYKPEGYFMNYKKRVQGGSFNGKYKLGDGQNSDNFYAVQTSATISKGKFSRNVVQGVEGNQGPYRLRGNDNEPFIIVLSGTERVYIDGKLLTRGQDYDYTIDYNTAEVTFTPNNLITKDRRIIVEFQYSDKNYARSLFQVANSFQKDKFSFWLNAYSEQDSKNQPLQQDLNSDQITVLSAVGDNITNAFASSIDSVGNGNDQVLYALIDSTVLGVNYSNVLHYTTHPDSAVYQASFSEVGQGNGNYVLTDFTAVGKVFQWVAPVGGNPQGNYEPVIVLIPPKRQQMVTLGGNYRFNKNTNVGLEVAYSSLDQNTFSALDAQDNQGYGLKFNADTKKELGKNGWFAGAKLQVENRHKNFNRIERYRAIEFERNWNVQGMMFNNSQLFGNSLFTLGNKKVGNASYGFNTLLAGSDYEGVKHDAIINSNNKNVIVDFRGSLLEAKSNDKSKFYRHKTSIKKPLKFFQIEFKDEMENNRRFDLVSDSLQPNAYQFYDWEINIASLDTTNNKFKLFYRNRQDKVANLNGLSKSANARHFGGSVELTKNRNQQLKLKVAYRTLDVLDTNLTSIQPENTILSRIDYNLRILKGVFQTTTFYEIGSGLELKREFAYLEVLPGQGVYAWIDYNGDNVKDLNEFEIAAFQDQATYIRVFTPTNEYVKTFTNQFNQSLFIKPAVIWRSKTGMRKFISKFSNQTVYTANRKTNNQNVEDTYNPFLTEIADTSLISLSSSIRNTFFFNRSNQKFGADYTYQNIKSKVLLTSGFDSRAHEFNDVRIRWNITRKLTWQQKGILGQKNALADYTSGRNYSIDYYTLNGKFSYQPGTTFRVSLIGDYTNKQNGTDFGGELAEVLTTGIEWRFNQVNKGSLLGGFNYVNNKYNGLENTTLAYEMLDALQIGSNFTWNLSYQRSISKHMQLNINYVGRKSPNNAAIHTGGVQVRAIF